MSEQWSTPAWLLVALVAAAAVLLVGLLVVVLAMLLPARRSLAAAREEAAALGDRLDALEQRLRAPAPADRPSTSGQEFVITHLGDADDASREAAPVVPGPVFADIVLRETVVQAATLAAGLRRALSPETRHRIRFEMRREVKRARKQRRLDTRTARREWEARQRAGLREQEHAA